MPSIWREQFLNQGFLPWLLQKEIIGSEEELVDRLSTMMDEEDWE